MTPKNREYNVKVPPFGIRGHLATYLGNLGEEGKEDGLINGKLPVVPRVEPAFPFANMKSADWRYRRRGLCPV